jgi:hypothetical protein
LAKLITTEIGSVEMRAAEQRSDAIACASIGYVELRAAAAAALRQGRIATRLRADTVDAIERLWQRVLQVSIDEPLVRQAGDLADRMELRGYDAIHLAALVASGPTSEVSLACWDAQLRRSAGLFGYQLIPA